MLPVQIGLRYTRARKGSGFLSFISGVSFFGLTLGVIALTVVVSVMNGFDRELKRRILGAVPHVVVEGNVESGGQISPFVSNWLATEPSVIGIARFFRRSAVVVHAGSNRLVSVFGIEPDRENEVSILPRHIVDGELASLVPESNRVFMGRPLAWQLGVRRGDTMVVIVPEPSAAGNAVRPRMVRVEVAGFFEVDSEVDYSLLLMHVDDLMRVVDARKSSLRLRLNDIFLAPAVARRGEVVAGVTGVRDWTDEFGDFFETVRMEKTMMFVLLTLIIAIAAFSIVSSLSMMVKEKQADIAVLRTLGLSPFDVMLTFVTQGSLVGVLGTLAGLLLGVPLAFFVPDVVSFFEDALGARMLAGTYFDRLPTDVRWGDVMLIGVLSILISLLATLYPAFQASRLQPAAVLRYE